MVRGLNTSLKEQGEALQVAQAAAAQRPLPTPPPRAFDQPPPPPVEVIVDSIEGFTAERMQQLERMLERERVAVKDYQRSLAVAEKALAKLQDELEAALGRMKDLQKRLGMGDEEAVAAVASLEQARKEVHALRTELGAAVGEASDVAGAPGVAAWRAWRRRKPRCSARRRCSPRASAGWSRRRRPRRR